MNIHEITLDVSKEPAHEPTLYIAQGDKNGTTLVVSMFDNGQVLDLTGLGVAFCMRTPGGQDFYQVAGTVNDNVATFLIDETYAAGHPGTTNVAYVVVVDGDTEITSTSRIQVVVLPSATEGVEPAPAYKSLIEEFLDEAQAEVDEAVAAAWAIVDYDVPLMSTTMRGGAKLGDGLSVDANEKLNVEPATTSAIGGVIPDGTSITIDNDGTIHGSASYQLPIATTSTLGGVKVDGTTITADNDGTIHGASAYTLPTMDASTKGGAKLGSGLAVDANDVLSVDTASVKSSIVTGQALAPASVTATGAIQGSSISDGTGTLAELRESVSHFDVINGISKVEFSIGNNYVSVYFYNAPTSGYLFRFGKSSKVLSICTFANSGASESEVYKFN